MTPRELAELEAKKLKGKHCIVCGKHFEYTHDDREFCGLDCYDEYNEDKKRIKELEAENEKLRSKLT